MIARLSALIVLTLGFTSCVSRDSDPIGPLGAPEGLTDLLPQRDLLSLQSFSGIGTKRGRIITDSADFQATWDLVFANYSVKEKPALPPIDFQHNVVLVASAGSTPTQLLWFRITMVRERTKHVAVLVESEWPPCGGLPVTTTPVHIVSVPRVATQAVFTFVDNNEVCS